jgi:hypothetical protein
MPFGKVVLKLFDGEVRIELAAINDINAVTLSR